MKFKITLNINREHGNLLPFNYQYEQSAVIYRILAQADTQYASWLHENGYQLNGSKRFKLFCYSPFIFERVRPLPKEGCLSYKPCLLFVSSYTKAPGPNTYPLIIPCLLKAY